MVSEGELIGPNQFGLMNGHLECVPRVDGGDAVCPNAFSERELSHLRFVRWLYKTGKIEP